MRNQEHEYNDENIMQLCSDQEFVYHFADSGTAENKLWFSTNFRKMLFVLDYYAPHSISTLFNSNYIIYSYNHNVKSACVAVPYHGGGRIK